MMRKLAAGDRAAAEALLARAPEHNLYMLGNLATIGFDADFCEFFGDFAEGAAQGSARVGATEGELRAVANRYFAGWVLYGLPEADWAAVAELIDAHPVVERLQDNPGGIESILPLLRRHAAPRVQVEVKVEELMRMDAADFVPQPMPPNVIVRRATLADKAELVALFSQAGNMHRSEAGVERPLRDATVMVGVISEGGAPRIVSVALTNAETRSHAMVGGVYTLPSARGGGIARAVVGALCAELLERGLTPCLYWDFPAAGKVYRTLGFAPIGDWRAVRFEPLPAPGGAAHT